jgi:hypothetical protein
VPTGEPLIIEVDAPHRPAFRTGLVVAVALAFTLVLPFLILLAWPLGVAVSSLFSQYPLYSVIATVASLTPVAILATRSSAKAAERRRTELAGEGRDLPIEDRIRLLVAKLGNDAHDQAAEIVPAIAKDNIANVVVLLGKARELRRSPLDVPFEPLPLNESSMAFASLDGATWSRDAAEAVQTENSPGLFDLPPAWRRRLTLGVSWILVLLFVTNLTQSSVRAVRVGKPTLELIWWVSLLFLTFTGLGLGGLGAWRSTDQWLLVPGGLVRRSARSRSGEWAIHLYTPASSLLFICEGRRTTRRVSVADAKTSAATEVTIAEAELLLRAWLSPIPPPSIEQLSDLV